MGEWITKECEAAPEADETVGTVHSWPQDGTLIVVRSGVWAREVGTDNVEEFISEGTQGTAKGYVEEWHDVDVEFWGLPGSYWIDVDNLRAVSSDD